MNFLSIAAKMMGWLFIDLAVACLTLLGCIYTVCFVGDHFGLPRQAFLISLSLCYVVATFVAFWGVHLIWRRRLPGL
jgi:hypothetical protein